jgi:hypothetical protein
MLRRPMEQLTNSTDHTTSHTIRRALFGVMLVAVCSVGVACNVGEDECAVDVYGYEVDTEKPCLRSATPEVYAVCLPSSGGGQLATGCYYNPDKQIVVYRNTTVAGINWWNDRGYIRCQQSSLPDSMADENAAPRCSGSD